MTAHKQYETGPASGADVQKNGDTWTLVLVRELRHAPEKVWQAITDPLHQAEWAPFVAESNLGKVGTLNVNWTGAPAPQETIVTKAEAPKVLEYNDMRWELEKTATGTRLTMWHAIQKNYVAMGAAGWHVCFYVLDHLLSGTPIGRIVGPDAMKYSDWQRLNVEYGKQFGVAQPSW